MGEAVVIPNANSSVQPIEITFHPSILKLLLISEMKRGPIIKGPFLYQL